MRNIIVLRIIGFYIDAFFCLLLTGVILFLLYHLLPETSFNLIENINPGYYQLITTIFYYIFMESIYKKTLGKRILGLDIVFEESSNSVFLNSIIRTFSRLIPFEPLSFLLTEDKRMWHDKFSSTRVVSRKNNSTENNE